MLEERDGRMRKGEKVVASMSFKSGWENNLVVWEYEEERSQGILVQSIKGVRFNRIFPACWMPLD